MAGEDARTQARAWTTVAALCAVAAVPIGVAAWAILDGRPRVGGTAALAAGLLLVVAGILASRSRDPRARMLVSFTDRAFDGCILAGTVRSKGPRSGRADAGHSQRQGRLIDFLQEDLSLYQDAQIGAAVRSVHAGCKQAIEEHVRLAPVYDTEEGAQITVEAGFDAAATRLIGAVAGQPPFTGVLRHRGWRVEDVELPQLTPGQGRGWILAPAEVEVG